MPCATAVFQLFADSGDASGEPGEDRQQRGHLVLRLMADGLAPGQFAGDLGALGLGGVRMRLLPQRLRAARS